MNHKAEIIACAIMAASGAIPALDGNVFALVCVATFSMVAGMYVGASC